MPVQQGPETEAELIRLLRRDLEDLRTSHLPKLERKITEQSMRLKTVEKAMWLGIGGVAVLTAFIVPIFIEMIINGGAVVD